MLDQLNGLSEFVHVRRMEPMSRYSAYATGGCADALIDVESAEELSRLLKLVSQSGIPFQIIGNGTNILVSDSGFRGYVIRLRGEEFRTVRCEGEKLFCGAGTPLPKVVEFAAGRGLSGLEEFWGIPGTVGGAVAMNAGAMGREMSDVTGRVEWMDFSGQRQSSPREEIGFGYRRCDVAKKGIVTGVEMELKAGDPERIRARTAEYRNKRGFFSKYPLNCGSVFKNPLGESAGRLLDRLGAKGMTVGGAAVCPDHANVIVNTGTATSADIYALMKEMRLMAREAGVELEPEIKLLGVFES